MCPMNEGAVYVAGGSGAVEFIENVLSGAEMARRSRADILRDNFMGLLTFDQLTHDEQTTALLALLPLALEIEMEARDTIERLNAENEELRRGNE